MADTYKNSPSSDFELYSKLNSNSIRNFAKTVNDAAIKLNQNRQTHEPQVLKAKPGRVSPLVNDLMNNTLHPTVNASDGIDHGDPFTYYMIMPDGTLGPERTFDPNKDVKYREATFTDSVIAFYDDVKAGSNKIFDSVDREVNKITDLATSPVLIYGVGIALVILLLKK